MIFSPTFDQVLDKLFTTSVVAVATYIISWPIRTVCREWIKLNTRLTGIDTELTTQRFNCLNTIQNHGTQQIEILERISTTLEDTHDTQLELSGWIKSRNQ